MPLTCSLQPSHLIMFSDRKDAALQLAKALAEYHDQHAVVLGIPRGGAETGYYVARELHAEFSLLIARKLGHPTNPEYAIGAVAEDGSRYLNPRVSPPVDEVIIDRLVQAQQVEIDRRIRLLRKGEPLPLLQGKIVILVDDGIATGSTLFAAIECCKKKRPLKLVVASPISGSDQCAHLKRLVDDVVILETPADFYAVSQGYASFPQLSDEEAKRFYDNSRQ